jgi:hypothetical protein
MYCSRINTSVLTVIMCGLLCCATPNAQAKLERTHMVAGAVALMAPALYVYSKTVRNAAQMGFNKAKIMSLYLAKMLPFNAKNKEKINSWISDIEESQDKRDPDEKSLKAEELSDSFIKATKLVGNVFLWLELFAGNTSTVGGNGFK